MEKEYVGRKIMETAQACCEGYRRNIVDGAFSENAVNEKCAVAASNTGWFILDALGFTNEEKQRLMDDYRRA